MNSWGKFDWPMHVWVGLEKVRAGFNGFLCTTWARINLRLHGAILGRALRVHGQIHVTTRRQGSIRIGDGVHLISRFRSNPIGITQPVVLDTLRGGEIHLGDHAGLSGVILSSKSLIEIGHHTQIGANARIFDHDYHSLDWEHRRDGTTDREHTATQPVRIGNDVFIGINAIILKGTVIGDRSIIGAGSVVAGMTIPPDSLVAGNPAVIRSHKKNPPDSP